MGKNFILSVVIPAYNVEKYIKHTVCSLLKGKRAIEILIVDDGSTDLTPKLADDFANQYPFIKVIHQQNGGHGAAINTGIENASGKYFKLLDGDDWVNSEDFSRLVDLLEEAQEDLILCDYHEIYMAEKKKKRVSFPFPSGKTLSMDMWHVDYLISMHAYIFRTSLLKNLPCPIDTNSFYVDMEYMLYPMPFIKNFRYETLDVYQYRLGRSGQSVSAEGFCSHYAEDAGVLRALIHYMHCYVNGQEDQANIKDIVEKTEAVTYYMPQRIFDMYYRHILKSIWYFDNREISIVKYLQAFNKNFMDNAPELYYFYRKTDSKKRSLSVLQLYLLRMTGFHIWRFVRVKKVISEIWKRKI